MAAVGVDKEVRFSRQDALDGSGVEAKRSQRRAVGALSSPERAQGLQF